MAYNRNGKVYTDHALMDEIIYNAKIIVNNIVLKNSKVADNLETEYSMQQSDYYLGIMNGSVGVEVFPFTNDMLVAYGYTTLQAKTYIAYREKIPKEEHEPLLKFCKSYFIEHYIETNDYYRMLNGEPAWDTDDEYYVYLNPDEPRLQDEDIEYDFDLDKPIHLYTNDQLNLLESLGIIDDIINEFDSPNYRYLRYLGAKKIGYYKARSAQIWDILYMPTVEPLVGDRFRELFQINRDIYYRKTYQDAFKLDSDYYDEMMMLCIVCQTFSDIIVDTPEWYIRRDIFDLRTCQYFLESQGVKFFKEIPLKYQIRIVKNINKLIRYKSTDKNIFDILEIFAVEGTTVYKYYLFKKFKRTVYEKNEDGIFIPDGTYAELDEDFDFGYEDLDPNIISSEGLIVYDFIDNDLHTPRSIDQFFMYDFGDEDEGDIISNGRYDYEEEKRESMKVIVDEDGNIYELEFVKTPIGDNYDDYIKDMIYRDNYDTLTLRDPYWDGEDVHSYVKNEHLRRDFTIEPTKYLSLDYKISMEEFTTQMGYFLTLIFQTELDLSDIRIPLPSIKQNMTFSLRNLFILLYCLNGLYMDRKPMIRLPNNVKYEDKPEYENYPNDVDGGYAWSGIDPDTGKEIEPPTPYPPDNGWTVPDIDGGDDTLYDIVEDQYSQYYDFGFNIDIPLQEHTRFIYDYDYGVVDEMSVEYNPNWVVPNLDFGSEDSDEPIEDESLEDEDYDFGENVTVNTVYYDFDYNKYQEQTIWNGMPYWYYYDKGYYDKNINGFYPDINKFVQDYDTGRGEYSVVTHETFYDWLRWKYPQLWVDLSGRILGFNMNADLDEIEKNISIRHSKFQFKHGFTLKDLGCDTFKIIKEAHTIDELVELYQNNIKCYLNLKELLINTTDRDERRIYQYVYDTLFTTIYPYKLYMLNNGEYAESYIDILKAKDPTLYRFYRSIEKEPDKEVRKDMTRDTLNNIVDTLSYYINGDHLEYVFAFVGTNSFEAIINYIGLMINFFKSWKVYFLDPTVTYVLNDKTENTQRHDDVLMEIKDKYWYNETNRKRDTVSIKDIYYYADDKQSTRNETLEILEYYVPEKLFKDYDGGEAEDMSDESINSNYPTVAYDLPIVNGAYQLEGGHIRPGDDKQAPYFQVNGGWVAARQDFKDIDGGGAITMQEYLEVNGKHVLDIDNNVTIFNPATEKVEEAFYDIDGGRASVFKHFGKTIITSINKDMYIQQDIKISPYRFNGMELLEDGLYVKDIFASGADFGAILEELTETRGEVTKLIGECKELVSVYGDYDSMCATIDDIFDETFEQAPKVLEDLRKDKTSGRIESYCEKRVEELRNWFINLEVFAWEEF